MYRFSSHHALRPLGVWDCSPFQFEGDHSIASTSYKALRYLTLSNFPILFVSVFCQSACSGHTSSYHVFVFAHWVDSAKIALSSSLSMWQLHIYSSSFSYTFTFSLKLRSSSPQMEWDWSVYVSEVKSPLCEAWDNINMLSLWGWWHLQSLELR